MGKPMEWHVRAQGGAVTDQTGAQQQGASGSRTGDVDVAAPSRPDTTTDVQSGGASDLGAGGPEAVTPEDDAAIRGGQDTDAPRSERDDSDQERDTTQAQRDDSSPNEARDSDESARDSEEDRKAADEQSQKTAEEFAREHDPEQHDVAA